MNSTDSKFPTTIHALLVQAHSQIDEAATTLSEARRELRVLEKRTEALLADDAILRELLVELAKNDRAKRAHFDKYRALEGGVYGPNGTPEMQEEWGVIARQEHAVESKLLAIANELLRAREQEEATISARVEASRPKALELLEQVIRSEPAPVKVA